MSAPTREMRSSLRRFVQEGATPTQAAQWAIDQHRAKWPNRESMFQVFAALKHEGDTMLRAALRAQAEAQAKPAPILPDWLTGLLTLTAPPPPIIAPIPPPIPVMRREEIRALFDRRRYVHHAQCRPVKAWAILLAIRLAHRAMADEVIRQLATARAEARARLRQDIARRKGWRISAR